MGDNRHGMMRDGWVRQAAQIPAGLSKRFKQVASKQGGGSVKSLTTIGLSLVTDMPSDYRLALTRYLAQRTVVDPDGVREGDLFEFLRQMIIQDERSGGGSADRGAKWYIDKILDPELTLPPEKKPSDRTPKREKQA